MSPQTGLNLKREVMCQVTAPHRHEKWWMFGFHSETVVQMVGVLCYSSGI